MNIMEVDTVRLDEKKKAVVIIDQTRLPGRIEFLELKNAEEIWRAIYLLQVRGAPAIGVCAALGLYVLAEQIKEEDYEAFWARLKKVSDYLNSSRPTAVNLSWALERMERCLEIYHFNGGEDDRAGWLFCLHEEALRIYAEDVAVCRRLGEYGMSLIRDGDGILTHCNAGKLAAVRYGTATAPIYVGMEAGNHYRVFCDETRPLLQGARLTAFELQAAGVDTTLICDNMSASVMKRGWVDAVFVGCDRVAANGDTANKIGTSVLAAVARQYKIPVYVVAPTSTIDMRTASGDDIVIEERKPEEVTEMWYSERMAPEGIKVYNPAFDVTDHSLIAGIVTEYGIARAPYAESFRDIFAEKEACGGDPLVQN